MDAYSQPQDLSQPSDQEPIGNKRKFGCSGCLIVVLGIILLAYVAVFQTSIPLKLIAGSIEKNTVIDGRRMEIKGVGGSLSRGVRIKELIIPGEFGDTTITNLKFKYRKPIRWFTRGQVVITEISTGSADFVVANDFFSSDGEPEDVPPDEWEEHHDATGEQDLATGEGFFDLRLLKFENTRLRTADGSVDVKIPLIHMKGLYIDKDDFRIDEFNIDSNVLSASLEGAGKAELDGKGLAFDQKLKLLIKPEIHEAVIRNIPVSFEFGRHKGRTSSRITAFDGALEQTDFGDGRSRVRLSSLSPNDYLNFGNHVIPDGITMTAIQEDDQVHMEAGSFRIGKTTFNFDSREFEDSNDESITGQTTVGSHKITAHIWPEKSDKAWPPMIVELSSQPETSKLEILALLHHGRAYDALDAEEKAAIDSFR